MKKDIKQDIDKHMLDKHLSNSSGHFNYNALPMTISEQFNNHQETVDLTIFIIEPPALLERQNLMQLPARSSIMQDASINRDEIPTEATQIEEEIKQ